MSPIASDSIKFDRQNNTLYCKGEWNLAHVASLYKSLNKIAQQFANTLVIDGKDIIKMDSSGAWLLSNGIKSFDKDKIKISYENFSKPHQKILTLAEYHEHKQGYIPREDDLNWLENLGKYGMTQTKEFMEFVNFIGWIFFESLSTLFSLHKWRLKSIASVINSSGANALPIIALLSLSIGLVISYQMGNQLRQYGANIFIVNLLGLSILREFGPLLTAILVGGRTGSAFTAQLGLMKINSEIDALTTMGITSAEILLIPRIAALFIIVPLLTVWADVFGVVGGMLMAHNMLGIGWHEFILRFQREIPLRSLIIGLGKAPVFALIIACVSCFEGMKVHGSAESVGVRTTKSVVIAIFLIITFDGVVSVLLSRYSL